MIKFIESDKNSNCNVVSCCGIVGNAFNQNKEIYIKFHLYDTFLGSCYIIVNHDFSEYLAVDDSGAYRDNIYLGLTITDADKLLECFADAVSIAQ